MEEACPGVLSVHHCKMYCNSLPNKKKTKTSSNLKAFADNKINATPKMKFVIGRVEITVGKGENADSCPMNAAKKIMFVMSTVLGVENRIENK